MNTTASDTYAYLYGGTISNNTAGSNGGAVYIKANTIVENTQTKATLKMRGNIFVDPGTEYKNDIYNAGPSIELDNNLTTENSVAALVTYSSLNNNKTVITSSNANIIANSCSKIKVREEGSQDIYDVTSEGYPDM